MSTIWVYESEPGHWETRDGNGRYMDELDARRLCPAGHRYAPAYADLNWFDIGNGDIENALEASEHNYEESGVCGDWEEPAIWMSDLSQLDLRHFLSAKAREWLDENKKPGYVEFNRFLVFYDLAQVKEAE